ncbi:non-hydrolyzing UDP-N-acetylglucosamine 2-epimerase [Helicobacter kayseriensis]|uniref:non-hydrolyzing UDP-N-acetylglucosamine 2-epimerase n=1 Tax=Helicobacter kayseriensis TaxID=2905877 RepID=UPI001E3DBCE1|nr:UDP-N-acetylglucosamine 2-epimerase (non-hydrolyzing) [Helicobacter kayseriensis]MCE3047205.1 UDP-N-acetylglucosamine 2-epimerase (non-hydrolyzing) [Helicobacter kayseriensis]MCE3048576.1 UDP-N-acetylglucosamine 2-epimerase (non-hydrolyzing) [Helicobacter kayseriensis]
MRILTIIGARPQFIKHAILQKKLADYGIEEILLHTGQHFDFAMSEVFFQELEMRKPQILLEIKERESLLQLGSMLIQMHQRLKSENFDCVVVYGDTTTTLAGSLFAKERGVKLVHIEAGLRSGDLTMPEERNRIMSDQISDLLFAPTLGAYENLLREDVKGKAFISGDVMLDSFLHFSFRAQKPQGVEIPRDFILCTLHRQSNVDDMERLRVLLQGLGEVGKKIPILLPLHPRTQRRLKEFCISLPSSICLLPPQGYLQTLWLLKHCVYVFTDSGGLQKEAYFAKKKCLVLREVSEWKELVESGACELLGQRTIDQAFEALGAFEVLPNLYGEGDSVRKILRVLKEELGAECIDIK